MIICIVFSEISDFFFPTLDCASRLVGKHRGFIFSAKLLSPRNPKDPDLNAALRMCVRRGGGERSSFTLPIRKISEIHKNTQSVVMGIGEFRDLSSIEGRCDDNTHFERSKVSALKFFRFDFEARKRFRKLSAVDAMIRDSCIFRLLGLCLQTSHKMRPFDFSTRLT